MLDNYDIPGHTPGCMMLLDKAHNILYSSDQLGCNRRSVADSLTLVNNDVRVLLSSLRIFRDKVTRVGQGGRRSTSTSWSSGAVMMTMRSRISPVIWIR